VRVVEAKREKGMEAEDTEEVEGVKDARFE
jgi:hypothetical protein